MTKANQEEKREDRRSDIENIAKKVFDDVWRQFLNPNVKGPYVDKEGTARYSFFDGTIGFNPEFLAKIAEKEGLADSNEAMLKGIFAHEIGHHLLHPFQKHIHIYLSFLAQERLGKEMGCLTYPLFIDVCDNVLLYRITQMPELERLLTTVYTDHEEAVMLGFYRGMELAIAKKKQGCDISEIEPGENIPTLIRGETAQKYATEIETAGRKIARLSIMPRHRKPKERDLDLIMEATNLTSFFEAIKPLIDIDKKDGKRHGQGIKISSSGDDNGEGTNNGSGSILKPEDVLRAPPHVRDQVRQGIQKLGTMLPRQEYDKIKEHFLPEENEKSTQGKGIGLGTTGVGSPDQRTKQYYREIIQQFGIYTPPQRLPGQSTERSPTAIRAYAPGDSIMHINTALSGGRIIPGLTTRREDEESAIPGTIERNPHLILYKDVSGSMSDPRHDKDPATVATGMLAFSRLRSGSAVFISLFDGEANNLVQVTTEDQVLEEICSYKGGGTHLDIERIREDVKRGFLHPAFDTNNSPNSMSQVRAQEMRGYLRKNAKVSEGKMKGKVDLVIVTDGGIANIDTIVEYAQENPELRPMILHTGGFNMGIPGYDGRTSGIYSGVRIWKVSTMEDIIEATRKMQLIMIYGEDHR